MWKSVGNLADRCSRHLLTWPGMAAVFHNYNCNNKKFSFVVLIALQKQFIPCCDDDCCEFVESSTSAAASVSCDVGALCTGMCVSRKILN